MASVLRRIVLGSASIALVCGVADAQTNGPVPYQPSYSTSPSLVTTPPTAIPGTVSDVEAENLRAALAAAKSGDVSRARLAMGALQDPLAKKIALWALVDSSAEAMSFFELDSARRDLAGRTSGRGNAARRKYGRCARRRYARRRYARCRYARCGRAKPDRL